MEIEPNTTVREIVVAIPASVSVLEDLGIDYCCGADKRLAEACQSAGLEISEVVRSIKAAEMAPRADTGSEDWIGQPLAKLMDHIVDKHHTYCRQEVARIEPLLAKVVNKHGGHHPEVRRISGLFSALSKELLMHLVKEEQTLFPYIARMEQTVTAGGSFPRPPFGTVQNPVHMMVLEHDNAGEALKEIRNLSSGYVPPPDACETYRSLYAGLKIFEADMHLHVHLENNVLFPRAVDLERAALSAAAATEGTTKDSERAAVPPAK